MVDEDRGFGPFYIEACRDTRLKSWFRLRQWFYDGNFEEGRFPYMSIEPWYEDPDPPWPRVPCTVPMTEVFYNSELHYSSIISMITSRFPSIYQKASPPDPSERPVRNPQLEEASEQWENTHPGLDLELKLADIPGLEGAELDGMKFLVFRTAQIPTHILAKFLESREQPDPRDDSFRAFEPFSYLIADTGGSTVEGRKASTTRTDLGHFPPSRFVGKSAGDVIEAFQEIVGPLQDRRSLYATRCFLVLDEITAQEEISACKVVVALYNDWCVSTVTFAALKKGILKAFEMLFLDPDMLTLDDRNLITENVYGPELR